MDKYLAEYWRKDREARDKAIARTRKTNAMMLFVTVVVFCCFGGLIWAFPNPDRSCCCTCGK